MKKTIISLALSSCLILGSTFAHSRDSSYGQMQNDSYQGRMQNDSYQGRMHDREVFKAMDVNSDAKITRDEFKDYALKQFDRIDIDRKGEVTKQDMEAWYQRMQESELNSRVGSQGSGNTDNTWDQQRDDNWHYRPDSSWDLKRDDAWHNNNGNAGSRGNRGSEPSRGGSGGQGSWSFGGS